MFEKPNSPEEPKFDRETLELKIHIAAHETMATEYEVSIAMGALYRKYSELAGNLNDEIDANRALLQVTNSPEEIKKLSAVIENLTLRFDSMLASVQQLKNELDQQAQRGGFADAQEEWIEAATSQNKKD